jgi:hypothetical protein
MGQPARRGYRFDRCHLSIPVIASASEAIQSRRQESWIASSLSLLAMTAEFKHAFLPRGVMRPRVYLWFRPSADRGRGECRVPNAPAAWCALK